MFQLKVARAFATLTLAVLLTLASSVPAQAAQRTAPAGIWGWLEAVWSEGIAGLWRTERPVPERGKGEGQAKEGGCVNPDGCARSLAGSPGPMCSHFNDEGGCVNPDG